MRRNKKIDRNRWLMPYSIAQRAFYNNLDVLIDEEISRLMKDPEVKAWATRITIEAFELILCKMKEKWA